MALKTCAKAFEETWCCRECGEYFKRRFWQLYCDECKGKPATVHLTQMFNGKKIETHLCDQCAAKKGALMFDANNKFSISNLLGNFFSGSFDIQEMKSVSPGSSCTSCGMNFYDIRETGKLGCADCYNAFEQELEPSLRRIHGNRQHVGKIPVRGGEKVMLQRQIDKMKYELQQAVGREEYEKAAGIRDQIKELEKKNA